MNNFLDKVHTAYTKDKNESRSIKAHERKIAYLTPKIKNYGKKAQEKGVIKIYTSLHALKNAIKHIKGLLKKVSVKKTSSKSVKNKKS